MLHPLFSTVIQRPDLVIDHVSAYVALLDQEVGAMGTHVVGRLVAWVLFVLGGFLFLSLTGIAIMLGFLQNHFHWMLIVVPGVALLITVAAFLKVRHPLPSKYFPELRAQLDSDVDALRMAK
ncbi:MAG: hypothetical protein V4454_03690 [Pseudomonadota bacterium]